jgi:hypothetical protein
MPHFDKVSDDVPALLASILDSTPCHRNILESGLKIDMIFAFCERDKKTGAPKNDALTLHGYRALAITKKIGPADRLKGMGDCEIRIDGDWWKEASEGERAAVLDHELCHIVVMDETDDLGRPKVWMRNHDFQAGWFVEVAKRHGRNSVEVKQAAQVREQAGQYFWPDLCGSVGSRVSNLEMDKPTITVKTAGHAPVTATLETFKRVASKLAKEAQ